MFGTNADANNDNVDSAENNEKICLFVQRSFDRIFISRISGKVSGFVLQILNPSPRNPEIIPPI